MADDASVSSTKVARDGVDEERRTEDPDDELPAPAATMYSAGDRISTGDPISALDRVSKSRTTRMRGPRVSLATYDYEFGISPPGRCLCASSDK